MGRTVPSFRIAAEIERTKWKQFRSYLDKKVRKMFDQMYDCVKLHNTACMMGCRPVVIHAVLNVKYFRTLQAINKIDGLKKAKDTTRQVTSGTLYLWT